jgi:S-adenosylmethionine synthetase
MEFTMTQVFYEHDPGFPELREIEVVERKGIGHPDTIADYAAEAISVRYSRHCLKEYGVVLHHNIDKLAIGGGLSEVSFGSGRLIRPIRVTLNGRMSRSFGGRPVPFVEIQEDSVRDSIAVAVPTLDVQRDLVFQHETTDHSATPTWFNPRNATDVPAAVSPFASDTSVCVSSWPPSPVERLVVGVEAALYADQWRPRFEDVGFDVKVMALRHGDSIEVVVCVPFLANFVASRAVYLDRREAIRAHLESAALELLGGRYTVKLVVNTQDACQGRRPYLTAVGTCLEFGEEGVVGRGNSFDGFIAMNRPHSVEAAFGKNPLYHAGKVYAFRTRELAKEISEYLHCGCVVMALARNGDPLFDCHAVVVKTATPQDPRVVEAIAMEAFSRRDHLDGLLGARTLVPREFLGPRGEVP